MKAVGRYVSKIAPIVKGLEVENGGPILMVQIENEYGSFGNDRKYMEWLRQTWVKPSNGRRSRN
jgi:beta-galactosidase